MLDKSKYNLVDDSVDQRIPADNDGQFQQGLTFEVKVNIRKHALFYYGSHFISVPVTKSLHYEY